MASISLKLHYEALLFFQAVIVVALGHWTVAWSAFMPSVTIFLDENRTLFSTGPHMVSFWQDLISRLIDLSHDRQWSVIAIWSCATVTEKELDVSYAVVFTATCWKSRELCCHLWVTRKLVMSWCNQLNRASFASDDIWLVMNEKCGCIFAVFVLAPFTAYF